MDEIADLIRLLAEAPAEEAPMFRPKEFLDRLAIEKVAQEGIRPEGPAVPDADAKSNESLTGTPSKFNLSPPGEHNQANPTPAPMQVGAAASPTTGMPEIGMPVRAYTTEAFRGTVAAPRTLDAIAGTVAAPRALDAIAGMPASPREAGDKVGAANPAPDPVPTQVGAVANPNPGMPEIGMAVRAYTTETFIGMVATPKILDAIAGMPATPKILDAIAGMPASPREAGDRIGVANPTPRSEVTITIPPAFPMDPKEAFSMVDEQLSLPPQQEPKEFREIRANTEDLVLESTEALVARSYQTLEGARSDIDRWSL